MVSPEPTADPLVLSMETSHAATKVLSMETSHAATKVTCSLAKNETCFLS